MNLTYVPLLRVQRDLQGMPRNLERFRRYLRTLSPDGVHVELPPLAIMNPMGKDHVTALLDLLLTWDADAVAAVAVAEASAAVADQPGDFKVGLVIADDLLGGWTNRYDYEYTLRMGPGWTGPKGSRPRWLKDFWLTAVLWSSETATPQTVREAVLTTIYRAAHVQRQGQALTLREMLAQEGHVMAAAGCSKPVLDDEDIEYTREVLIPFMDAADKRTAIECLFGDAAGRTLGFTPRGLSPWAGLALALHDARSTSSAPSSAPGHSA
jgi:hypothetical protein